MEEHGGFWSVEAMTFFAIAALLGVSMLLSRLAIISLKKPSKLPPGPRALPIIGHLHLLGKNVPQSLAQISHRYGPLIYLKLGSIPCVVASSPETARQLLQTCDSTFAFRPDMASAEAIYGATRAITTSDPGPYWRYLRQLCATDLFSPRRLSAFKPIRDEELSALLQTIYAEDVSHTDPPSGVDRDIAHSSAPSSPSPVATTKTVHLRPRLQGIANKIISRMVLGEASQTALAPVLVEVVEALSVVNLGDLFPWIRWADLQGCVKQSKKAGQRMHAAFQGMIDRRREQRGGIYEPPADIFDVLLSAALTCPKDLQITDGHIRSALTDFFLGGTDTSAVVAEWTMAELLANPSKMRKLEEEIEDVVRRKDGKETVLEDADVQGMPYLSAVVKETMRLHPAVPLLAPKESRNACTIYGFGLPAKTQAFVNTWAIGRDPKVWENPSDFSPERFLHSNIDVRGQHFEFLPFGSGRRVCPALNLGLLFVHLTIAHLVHAFSWIPHDQEHDMSEKFGFVTKKANPLVARAIPKQPRSFYMPA